MTKLSEIRAWKEKWGYDDMAVMPGGRPMKQFAPDRSALDRLAKGLEDDAAKLREKLAPSTSTGPKATPTAMTEEDSSKLLAQALALEDKAAKLRSRFENPATARLNQLAGTLDEAASGKKDEASQKLGTLAGELRIEAERIRLIDESPDGKLIHAAVDLLRPTSADEADSLVEWADDLAHPYDPAQGPLASSIADRVCGRDILDRTAAIDQVTKRIYSTDRRAELERLTKKSYLASEFGLRAIKEETRNGQLRAGILFEHDSSSTYQRDDMSKAVEGKMQRLYAGVRGVPPFDEGKVFFVNNKSIAAKLDGAYTREWIDPQPNRDKSNRKYRPDYQTTATVAPGIYAVIMKKSVGQGFKTRLLEGSGCTPSAYQVEKAASGDTRDPLTHPDMRDSRLPDNTKTLERVAGSPGCKALANLPDDSPMKQAAAAASRMVEGLRTALAKLASDRAKSAALKDNKIVASALGKIEQLMQVMPTYSEDAPRFSRLFDLLVDEVNLVLATCKPYGKDDFRQAAGAMVDERIPTLKDDEMVRAGVKHQTAMLSSGMDGLSTATAAAFAATGSKKLHLINGGGNHSANYFEVESNLLGSATKGPTGAPVASRDYKPPVIMGSLNPSTPVKQAQPGADPGEGDASWSVAELIEQIKTVLEIHEPLITPGKPAIAIIDVTVERNGSGHDQEMDKIVAHATIKKALKDDKLKLMLAKSYQKYPSLGAGKAMAAGLTVIGKNADDARTEPFKTVAATEQSEALLPDPANPDSTLRAGADESQIVTHFMATTRDAERAMLERAAKNAKFVRDFMPPDTEVTSPEMRYDEGLPFIVLKKKGLRVKNGKGGVRDMNVSSTLHQQGAEERMSFGFQNTSCLGFGDLMRVGVGQESEEDLVEKLYAATNLAAKPSREGIDVAGAKAKALGGAQKAMTQATAALAERAPDDTDGKAWRARMIRVLVAANQLTPQSGGYRFAGSEPTDAVVKEPDLGDEKLKQLLKSVGDRVSAPGTDARAQTAAIATTLKVVGALRNATVTDPGFALSTNDTMPREEWIGKAETELTRRGRKLPNKDDDPATYAKALRGALHDADDVNLMHASVKKGWDGAGAEKLGFEAKYLPNMIASWTNLIATNMSDLPGGPAMVCELTDTLTKEGLDDLSPEGQQRLLQRRIEAALGRNEMGLKGDTKAIGEAAEGMPYREGPARLITGPQLKTAATRLTDDADLKKLVAALSGSLDLATQCDALEQLASTPRDAQATRIAKQFIPLLRAKFDEAAKAYADPGTVDVPASLKGRFEREFRGTNTKSRKEERERLEAKSPRTKQDDERLFLLQMYRLVNTAGPLKADQPEPPTAIGDIRSGSTAAADHGPEPMSKEAFDKLRAQFDGIARRVK